MTAERVILLDGSNAALDFSLTPFYRVLYVHKYTSPHTSQTQRKESNDYGYRAPHD